MQQDKALSGPFSPHAPVPATLLVADDDPQLRELYQVVMEGVGHRVRLASNGRECFELYRDHLEGKGRFDLVLLDLYMPVMDGRQCLERIFDLDPKAKVLLATGSPDEELGPLAEKMAGVVIKPVSIVHLLDQIKRCLDEPLAAAQAQVRW